MRTAILRLHHGIAEIRQFLDLVSILEEMRKKVPPFGEGGGELARLTASTVWRRQYYAFAVVGLYGVHERYMRDLLEGIARFLATAYHKYSDLPERVRQEHTRLTVKKLQDLAGK